MAYTLKAGTYSTNGLVLALGLTSERETGLLSVAGVNNWLARLNSKNYTAGPTGAWKNEWLSVFNYLNYSANSICYIGATGSTGAYMGYSLANTPLHNKNLVDLDVIFDAGDTFSAGAAKSVAQTRQDCIAIIGNKGNMSPVAASYSSENTDFGITSANSEYICFIAGRRQYDIQAINSSWKSEYVTTNFSADIAGLMAFNSYQYDISTVVAGVGTNKTLKFVPILKEQYSTTDVTNLTAANINPIRQFSGIGTFLMGNKTYKKDATSPLNNLNITATINYIKREIEKIAYRYLFTPNNVDTRSRLRSDISGLLDRLFFFSAAGGATYSIICNNTNNTSATSMVANIIIDIPSYVGTVTINLVNNANQTTISTVTVQ